MESSTSLELKRALSADAHYLPGKSDRRFALSLATYARELSSSQQYHAKQLLERAARYRASGDKRTADELFTSGIGNEGGNGSAMRIEVALAADDIFDEAPKAAQAALARDAQEAVAQLDASALESIVRKILEPGLASVAAQVARSADERQAAFERLAARTIAEQVVTRVLDEMEKRKPREVRITVESRGETRTTQGKVHRAFEHLVRVASLRLANGYAPGIFLAGEAGSGKTHGTRMLADVLGLSWHFNGAISFPHEMLGFIDAGGTYHRTPFREAYEHGGVYTFDEVDRSDPVALLAVNPHLANGIATFPDGQVKRHEDCIIVATANTWGHGADAQYSGATKLDAAFLSRFPARIAWDIDSDLEEELVGRGAWLNRIRAARARARNAGLKIMIDTRHAQAGSALIAAGYTLDEAASMTYLAGLKPDQRKRLGDA